MLRYFGPVCDRAVEGIIAGWHLSLQNMSKFSNSDVVHSFFLFFIGIRTLHCNQCLLQNDCHHGSICLLLSSCIC